MRESPVYPSSEWRERYEALLVDLDGTLYRAGPVRLGMAGELMLTGPHVVRALSTFRKHHELVRHSAGDGGLSPYEQQLKLAAAALGWGSPELETVVTRWMVERPVKWLKYFARVDLLQSLARYKELGGRIAVVSDYPARHKMTAFRKWLSVDLTVANGEEGGPRFLKPSPEGYLKAAELLGVPPERCLVLGDRLDADGAAAKAGGMHFLHVR